MNKLKKIAIVNERMDNTLLFHHPLMHLLDIAAQNRTNQAFRKGHVLARIVIRTNSVHGKDQDAHLYGGLCNI